jgi:hypothetical protein
MERVTAFVDFCSVESSTAAPRDLDTALLCAAQLEAIYYLKQNGSITRVKEIFQLIQCTETLLRSNIAVSSQTNVHRLHMELMCRYGALNAHCAEEMDPLLSHRWIQTQSLLDTQPIQVPYIAGSILRAQGCIEERLRRQQFPDQNESVKSSASHPYSILQSLDVSAVVDALLAVEDAQGAMSATSNDWLHLLLSLRPNIAWNMILSVLRCIYAQCVGLGSFELTAEALLYRLCRCAARLHSRWPLAEVFLNDPSLDMKPLIQCIESITY